MNGATLPPRFVPTLTDVVHAVSNVQPEMDLRKSDDVIEDQMVHRIMQRVDLVLERRLREAVAQAIIKHTQTLAPRLREEIELVVRESVMQAVAMELPAQEK